MKSMVLIYMIDHFLYPDSLIAYQAVLQSPLLELIHLKILILMLWMTMLSIFCYKRLSLLPMSFTWFVYTLF